MSKRIVIILVTRSISVSILKMSYKRNGKFAMPTKRSETNGIAISRKD